MLSSHALGMLLDWSKSVFTDRRKGWLSEVVGKKKVAFVVYEAPVHNGDDLVAKFMGKDVPE